MANFTCLASARDEVLRRAGWDPGADGLNGAPPVRVLVGEERHDSVDLVLRYLGLGRPEAVAADDQGRIRPDALAAALASGGSGPTIVALQAGNVHSGAFDPFPEAIRTAHEHDAWVHVDGAFGLFAAASDRLRHLTAGIAAADSWGTDAHKTLNVPYDCGIAIVRDPVAMKAAMGMHGDYLIQDADKGDSFERVPELSRRARALPVWAVLRSLGRSGVAELVDGLAAPRAHLRRSAHRDRGGGGSQRRRLHPGVCLLRLRRPHPGGRPPRAGGRHRVDVRVPVAGPGGAPDLGQQLVDHRRGRRAQPRRAGAGARRRTLWVVDPRHPDRRTPARGIGLAVGPFVD